MEWNGLDRIGLHSIASHCTALHITALHSASLHCTAQHCIAQHRAAPGEVACPAQAAGGETGPSPGRRITTLLLAGGCSSAGPRAAALPARWGWPCARVCQATSPSAIKLKVGLVAANPICTGLGGSRGNRRHRRNHESFARLSEKPQQPNPKRPRPPQRDAARAARCVCACVHVRLHRGAG